MQLSFLIKNRQRFFVSLHDVAKIFRTPTISSENVSYPYTMHFGLSPEVKNDWSLMPPKYTLNDLIFISHNHAYEKIVPDKDWLEKNGKNSDWR